MSSMSYCLFQNITAELYQIIERISDFSFDPENLSVEEKKAFNEFKEQIKELSELTNFTN